MPARTRTGVWGDDAEVAVDVVAPEPVTLVGVPDTAPVAEVVCALGVGVVSGAEEGCGGNADPAQLETASPKHRVVAVIHHLVWPRLNTRAA
ncbi:MAG TPA: hypothetical protein VIJ15_09400 [Dermatophilaceae bacterium]